MGRVTNFYSYFEKATALKRKAESLEHSREDVALGASGKAAQNLKKVEHIVECSDLLDIFEVESQDDVHFVPISKPSEERIKLIGKRTLDKELKTSNPNILRPIRHTEEIIATARSCNESAYLPSSSSPPSEHCLIRSLPLSLNPRPSKSSLHSSLSASRFSKKFKSTGSSLNLNNGKHPPHSLEKACSSENSNLLHKKSSEGRTFASHIDKDGFKIPLPPSFRYSLQPNRFTSFTFSKPQSKRLEYITRDDPKQKKDPCSGSIDAYTLLPSDDSDGIQLVEDEDKANEERNKENFSTAHKENLTKAFTHKRALKLMHYYKYFKRKKPKIRNKNIPLGISLNCKCTICKEMKILLKKFNEHQLSAYGMKSFCFKSIEDALSLYLCQKEGTENYYYDKKCIYGYCENCHYKKMKKHFLKIEKSYSYKPLSFTKFFENFKGNLKMLCRDIKILARHYFVLKWQCFQFWQIQQNLPSNSALVMCCCSVKLRLKEVEPKLPLAILYPFIVYYNHPEKNELLSEEICFIMPGTLTLDANVLGHFVAAIGRHLKQYRHLDLNLQIQFVCGCNELYKSPMVLLDIATSPHKIKCPIIRNFFDDTIGHVLKDVREKIKTFWSCFKKNLTNKEMFNLLQCKKYKKEELGNQIYNLIKTNYVKLGGGSTLIYYGISSTSHPPNRDLVSEDVLPFFSQIKSGKGDEIILYRKLICLCENCIGIQHLDKNDDNLCKNKTYVRPFKAFSLIRCKNKPKEVSYKKLKENYSPLTKKTKSLPKGALYNRSPIKKQLSFKREAIKKNVSVENKLKKEEKIPKAISHLSPKKSNKPMIKPPKANKRQSLISQQTSPVKRKKKEENDKNDIVKQNNREKELCNIPEKTGKDIVKRRGRPRKLNLNNVKKKPKSTWEPCPYINIFEQNFDNLEVVQVGSKSLRRKGRNLNSQIKASAGTNPGDAPLTKKRNLDSEPKKKAEEADPPLLNEGANKLGNDEKDLPHFETSKTSQPNGTVQTKDSTPPVAQVTPFSNGKENEKYPDQLPFLIACNEANIDPHSEKEYSHESGDVNVHCTIENTTFDCEKQLPNLACSSPPDCFDSREDIPSHPTGETLQEIHLPRDCRNGHNSHESDPGYESSPPPLLEALPNDVHHSTTTSLFTSYGSNDNLLLENIPTTLDESSKREHHNLAQTPLKENNMQVLPDAAFEQSSLDNSDNSGYISDSSTPTQGLPSSMSDSSGASNNGTYNHDSVIYPEEAISPHPTGETLHEIHLSGDNGNGHNTHESEKSLYPDLNSSISANPSKDDLPQQLPCDTYVNDADKIITTEPKEEDKEKSNDNVSLPDIDKHAKSTASKPVTTKKNKRKNKPCQKIIQNENGLPKANITDVQDSSTSSSNCPSQEKAEACSVKVEAKNLFQGHDEKCSTPCVVDLGDSKISFDEESQSSDELQSNEGLSLAAKEPKGKISKSEEILRKNTKKYLDKCVALVKGAKWVPGLVKGVGEHSLRVIFFQKSGEYLVPQSWNEVMQSHKPQKENEVGLEYVLGVVDPPKCIDDFGHALLTDKTVRKGDVLFEKWCRAHPELIKASKSKSPSKGIESSSSSSLQTKKKRTASIKKVEPTKSTKRTCRI